LTIAFYTVAHLVPYHGTVHVAFASIDGLHVKDGLVQRNILTRDELVNTVVFQCFEFPASGDAIASA
jgi:hypothetical protein